MQGDLIAIAIRNGALAGAYRAVGEMDPACRPGMTKLADRAHAVAAAALKDWCGKLGREAQPLR